MNTDEFIRFVQVLQQQTNTMKGISAALDNIFYTLSIIACITFLILLKILFIDSVGRYVSIKKDDKAKIPANKEDLFSSAEIDRSGWGREDSSRRQF